LNITINSVPRVPAGVLEVEDVLGVVGEEHLGETALDRLEYRLELIDPLEDDEGRQELVGGFEAGRR
jgi:hypothetical protein